MISTYAAEDLGDVLGIPANRIMDYGNEGLIPYGRELGTNIYYSSSADTILREEINLEENKGRILQERDSYIIKKDSLEKMLEVLEQVRPDSVYLKFGKPRAERGSQDYSGEIEYLIELTQKTKITHEQAYNIEKKSDFSELKKEVIEDLESTLKEKGIKTRVDII